MRPLPWLPSDLDPASWLHHRDVELRWAGSVHLGWRARSVHAIHLSNVEAQAQLQEAQEALGAGLHPDFLVLPVHPLADRRGGFALLGVLEALLQVTQGRLKVVLRPQGDALSALLTLLQEAKGDAIGFCWQPGLDPEPIADRLWCAVGDQADDFAPLQRLGYRWNLAMAAPDPMAFEAARGAVLQRFPPVLFPEHMPQTALGRPVEADPEVRFGASWGKP